MTIIQPVDEERIHVANINPTQVSILHSVLRQCRSDYQLRLDLSVDSELKAVYRDMINGISQIQEAIRIKTSSTVLKPVGE